MTDREIQQRLKNFDGVWQRVQKSKKLPGSAKLMPDIVVDCMYRGEVNSALEGAKIDISPCVEVLHKSYRQISVDYELDNILTTVWVRKGEFVEQSVLKRIIEAIEKEDEQ